ncbi:hypothetical protein P0082_04545 [Candidatus Haliotispira prima]|uniref:Uncharacterized protein n=1 Tax=Candidatus Haliotispira prima TaxID=3034016 RepID=A0ABY8MKK7_9SPIO|nr:hypothetical protein P0082_04545 [Candidatus Haliotispira prima]
MVSSVQLEVSSSLALANIGAVIRLATEAAPTKAEAEANAGYVSLGIAAGSTRKFSISQHYGSDFEGGGLTPADVLAPETQYKLYLFFGPGTVNPIEGVSLTNDVATLSFTTAALPPAGDAVWARSLTGEQLVGTLPEWGYSKNQKGVFVAYTRLLNGFIGFTLTTRKEANSISQTLGTVIIGSVVPDPKFLFGFSKLSGSYPDTDNYYYIIATEKEPRISGNNFQLENVTFGQPIIHRVLLTRYGSP